VREGEGLIPIPPARGGDHLMCRESFILGCASYPCCFRGDVNQPAQIDINRSAIAGSGASPRVIRRRHRAVLRRLDRRDRGRRGCRDAAGSGQHQGKGASQQANADQAQRPSQLSYVGSCHRCLPARYRPVLCLPSRRILPPRRLSRVWELRALMHASLGFAPLKFSIDRPKGRPAATCALPMLRKVPV
jgi:hypothetical protein